MIFLIFVFLIINFIEDPKSAHKQIEGRQTNGAVTATKDVAIKNFRRSEKKRLQQLTLQPTL